MRYLNRVADKMLQERLETFGAVLIEGPKWTGKTTTAEQHAKSFIKLQDPDMAEEYLATAATKPSLLLKGEKPKLIDEWQDAPVIWDAVRTAVDNANGAPGQYILTGSNAVDKTKIRHTGTGRITRMKMYPMSLWESLESSGEISIRELFDNPAYDIDGASSKLDVPGLIRVACRGGWPATLQMNQKSAMLVAKDYVNSVCENDITRVDGKQRNPKIARQIMRSYARNISTLAKKTNILTDVTASGDITISMDTYDDYVEALERLFVIQDIDAWCPAIRSKSSIRSTKKRNLIDPSIAVAAMGLSPEYFNTDFKTLGFLFESLCLRDLKIYSSSFDGSVSYYHDRYGLEVDCVLHLNDGRYALIEFKLGTHEIEDGARHLNKIEELIKEHNKEEKQCPIRLPDSKIIITGAKYGYKRDDGVFVIPIGCIKN